MDHCLTAEDRNFRIDNFRLSKLKELDISFKTPPIIKWDAKQGRPFVDVKDVTACPKLMNNLMKFNVESKVYINFSICEDNKICVDPDVDFKSKLEANNPLIASLNFINHFIKMPGAIFNGFVNFSIKKDMDKYKDDRRFGVTEALSQVKYQSIEADETGIMIFADL
jgi:hypothetical protein